MDKDDIKRVEDLLALVESNIRAIREYLDERLEEVEELEDQIMAILRKT
jgi:archaellum component FlaC